MQPSTRPAVFAALFAGLLAVSSCRMLPEQRGKGVEVLVDGDLDAVDPNDVVIAPVELADGVHAPTETLRRCFQEGLVRRRYSPLALETVDANVIDAAYRPGELREDAVLQIVVQRWNEGLWNARTALDAAVEVRMLDARDGRLLWSGRVDRRYDLAGKVAPAAQGRRGLDEACAILADDVLAAMPARDTVPDGSPSRP